MTEATIRSLVWCEMDTAQIVAAIEAYKERIALCVDDVPEVVESARLLNAAGDRVERSLEVIRTKVQQAIALAEALQDAPF